MVLKIILPLLLSSQFAFAKKAAVPEASKETPQVLFEGYSKIILKDAHIGYSIARYEYFPNSKKFTARTFLKIKTPAIDVTESLRASADQNFAPLTYEYTSLSGKDSKIIDANFSKGSMTAKVTENKKTKSVVNKIESGTLLSTFLIYLILKNPAGLTAQTKYDYKAVAEEDATIEKGSAEVGKEEKFEGLSAYKIKNLFKKATYVNYVNSQGEVLGTSSESNAITSVLVADASDATKGISVPTGILKDLFGDIPKGEENILFRTKKAVEAMKPTPGKKEGVPQGDGIEVKAKKDEK